MTNSKKEVGDFSALSAAEPHSGNNLYKSFDKFWFQHKLNIWELAFNILNLILAGFCWDVLCKVCFGCGFEFVFIFKRSLNANENHQMLMKTTKWGEIVHCDLSTHRLLSVTHRSPWGGEGCLAELKLSMDMKSTQSFRQAKGGLISESFFYYG